MGMSSGVHPSGLAADLEFRGLIHQVTDPGLPGRLDAERFTAYIGFDPTADSLHVGHLVQVLMLRRLRAAGHRVIALAGGATGLIGDPGGKSAERQLLDPEVLRSNVEALRAQLGRFVDIDGTGAVLLDNSEWLSRISLIEFLRDVGKYFTVNQMVSKESVRSRLDRPDQGISFTEFSYMLLQAYDFLHLFDSHGCRLQLGASDQWGNITMGIELIKKVRSAEAWGLTTPLLLKPDGTKFGKSEFGTVWLDPARTSPYQLYQFLVRSEDSAVGSYLRLLTFLDHDAIRALDAATEEHPERREAQRALAREVCTLVHGAAEATKAEAAAAALYDVAIANLDEATLLDVCAEAPAATLQLTMLDGDGFPLADLAVASGLLASKSQARAAIAQGGMYVNNRRRGEAEALVTRDDLLWSRYVVLRHGRRNYHLVRFE